MSDRVLTITDKDPIAFGDALVRAIEAGKVLHFPALPASGLGFAVTDAESRLLRPDVLLPKVRNISLRADGTLAGAQASPLELASLAAMIERFRARACALIDAVAPRYKPALRLAPTSYRPLEVESRAQSWRADDRRLHVDAFPSRPSRGERILRVFTNVNPQGRPRVWRVGESFETIAQRFVPRARRYVAWQAHALRTLRITKSLRSEYDHLMLQIHDGMKSDPDYQARCPQVSVPFAPGAMWVCYSDQAAHAAMSGQHMLEQTLHLEPARQSDPASSPLAILERQLGRRLT